MRYLKLFCGVFITGVAYFTMFIQFIFYADESISGRKLIMRQSIGLFFIFIGVYLILANKNSARKNGTPLTKEK